MATIIRPGAENVISLYGFAILVHAVEEGETGFWGEVHEMPGCVSQGETIEELMVNIREAIDAVSQHSLPEPSDTDSHSITWPPTLTGTLTV